MKRIRIVCERFVDDDEDMTDALSRAMDCSVGELYVKHYIDEPIDWEYELDYIDTVQRVIDYLVLEKGTNNFMINLLYKMKTSLMIEYDGQMEKIKERQKIENEEYYERRKL